MGKDVTKLLILLVVVVVVVVGIYFIGKSVDNKSKYTHPITRDGAKW